MLTETTERHIETAKRLLRVDEPWQSNDQTTATAVAEELAVIEAERRRARRERIATAVLAGWVSAFNAHADGQHRHVRIAVEYADALIAELDKGA